MKTKKTKEAISLIVLVLTIVIMIILGGVIILNLSNSGIIDKANNEVSNTNLKQINELASVGWALAYGKGARTEEDLYDGVIEYLESSVLTTEELMQYAVSVTTKGVKVVDVKDSPWVTSWIDGVPIPKGFVVSPYGADEANGVAENTKDGGLVIYELKAGEKEIPSTETYYTSLTTRNQYVWVPVEKDTFDTAFIRKQWKSENISSTLGSGYWEVTPDLELTTENLKYMTKETLKEVQRMYSRVKTYGGFYVARYEAGLDESNVRGEGTTGIVKTLANVHSKMNKIPYNFIDISELSSIVWEDGGAVEVSRSLYPKNNGNYGVVSTLMYGVQWDRILSWWEETNAITSVTNSSTAYGNYCHTEIALDTFNQGAKYSTSFAGTSPTYSEITTDKPDARWLLTTGATEIARKNNIYDMAGNLWEWTMEVGGTKNSIRRGEGFHYSWGASWNHYVYTRDSGYEWNDEPSCALGFRVCLYIK